MKSVGWLMTMAPALLIAGMSTATARGWGDLWCRWFQHCSGDGGGAVSVSEPGMLALFGVAAIVAGVVVFRRRSRR